MHRLLEDNAVAIYNNFTFVDDNGRLLAFELGGLSGTGDTTTATMLPRYPDHAPLPERPGPLPRDRHSFVYAPERNSVIMVSWCCCCGLCVGANVDASGTRCSDTVPAVWVTCLTCGN